MKTVLTANKRSNPDVKQGIILFTRPEPRSLEKGQFHIYKLCTTPADVLKLSRDSITITAQLITRDRPDTNGRRSDR
eukprot:13677479-Ditylum_brightwellii.AAC.1